MHYKEYLVSLINRNGIDPIPIMETNDLVQLLERTDIKAPERERGEREDAYRKRIIEVSHPSWPPSSELVRLFYHISDTSVDTIESSKDLLLRIFFPYEKLIFFISPVC